MTVIAGHNLRVANRYQFAGTDDQVNVLNLTVVNTDTGLEADALNDIREFLVATYGELVGAMPDTTLHADVAVFNTTTGGPVGLIPKIDELDGTSAGQGLPPQNAPLVILTTAISRVQGRIYLPTPDEGSADNGVITAGYQGVFDNFITGFLVNFVGTNGTTLRYHVVGTSGSHIPTSARLVQALRTQRRRTAGRGS